LPCAVVGRVENQRVLVQAQLTHLVHDPADASIELDHRVRIFALGHRLADVIRVGHVRLVNLHEIDVHEERRVRLGVAIEIVD
jgi:hypothetical protein